jgi:D-alanyl-lipoteichoic acid acyltransferase DltB (MBOAT superfamily)
MLFNSLSFLLIFLPITLFGFWLCRRYGDMRSIFLWLFACSAVFYSVWSPPYILLLIVSIIGNYFAALWIARTRSRLILGLAIAGNLIGLGYFKYTNFLISSVNGLTSMHIEAVPILLPLGISFVTFIQIAFLVDVYRKRTDDLGFPKYALFVAYFPHLIAGPIIHHKEVMSQFTRERMRSISHNDVAIAVALIVIGLFKKVVVADTMAGFASPAFRFSALGQPVTFIEAWASILAFTFQIYFDFSGYSDIAIGLSRFFGVKLPVNFNSPYKSTSIIDFWRRWHITLSRFLRDYLYIPLGGNRSGLVRRYVNLMIVMLLGGLWHGASWLFVVWGGLHGFYLIVNHGFRYLMSLPRSAAFGLDRWLPKVAALTVFPAVVFAWVFFRSESWDGAMAMLQSMAGMHGIAVPTKYLARLGSLQDVVMTTFNITAAELPALSGSRQIIWLFFVGLFVFFLPNSQELLARFEPALERIPEPKTVLYRLLQWRPNVPTAVATAGLALFVLFKIYSGAPGEFIYFQF